jgi:predicted metal-dependent hydrolase
MAGRKQETQLRTAGSIQYELTRKRVKNLNIRVREDGTVAVSIPLRTSAEAADRFVAARADWVQQARERAMRRAAQEARPLPDKETALAYFTAMSDKVYPAFAGVLGGHKPVIKVRSMTSRWGVCFMAKRQITFALQLYHMPPAAQIYVVVHEYCHFLQPNHSPAFWAEVAKLPTTSIRMAIAFIAMLPLFIIYPFLQKYFAEGITLGAVKG